MIPCGIDGSQVAVAPLDVRPPDYGIEFSPPDVSIIPSDDGTPSSFSLFDIVSYEQPGPPEEQITRGIKPFDRHPVFDVCWSGSVVELRDLISESQDINLSILDELGRAPIHVAAGSTQPNAVQIIRVLLSMGCSPDTQDIDGQTPLFYAARSGNTEVAVALLSAGAMPSPVSLRGETPLMVAAVNASIGVVHLLLDHGAAPQQPDSPSSTSLFYAVTNPEGLSVVRLLVGAGLRPGITNRWGMPIIAYAIQSRSLESIEYLLQRRVPLSNTDDLGLMLGDVWALSGCDTDVADLFARAGIIIATLSKRRLDRVLAEPHTQGGSLMPWSQAGSILHNAGATSCSIC